MKLSQYIEESSPVINEGKTLTLINIMHGKDQITMDFRTHQIRYLKDAAKHGPVQFFPLSDSDADSYLYLLKNDMETFKSSLAEDLTNMGDGLHISPLKMKVIPPTDTVQKESVVRIAPVLNEDDTGIPYMAMGGVFTKDVRNLSKFVDIQDRMQVQKAIIDMFTLYPEVSADMIAKLATNLKMDEPALVNQIYSVLSSFLNKGKWNSQPNTPIDPQQLQMGIKVEFEHTDNPLLAERIARDHLSEQDPMYYTHLMEMENKYKA